jgi:hypothetical protein
MSHPSDHDVALLKRVVRDLSGKMLLDRMVIHAYRIEDGLIQSMDIRG